MVNPRAGERGGSFCMNSPAKSKPFAANVDCSDRESMTARVYLDWNASAPLRPVAREAACAALELCGNPSSVHGEGRVARRTIEQAREDVATLTGAEPRNVIFTSGGTEA